MNRQLAIATLIIGILSGTVFAAEPLRPGYRPGQNLQLIFWGHCVSGPGIKKPGEGSALVCRFSTHPVVMIYTHDLNPSVIRLVQKLSEATGSHKKERLGSYLVLLCNPLNREAELLALANKAMIQNTVLAMAVPHQKFLERFSKEAETTVVLATAQRQVKACYAYRKGELKDRDIDLILEDLPKILPKQE